MAEDFDECALEYHRSQPPGKVAVVPTKPLENQRDLALAYSPGVAAACREIVKDPLLASEMTARGNLVAVISNGTAVLGLGDIGPLASKPVMEGKGVLFKKFAGIDVFDIEIDETDPDKLVDIIASLEPSFGGINLEDIKAPECFEVERRLKQRMNIPVFHDDQHGTAIIVAAAVFNGLEIVGKSIDQVRVVTSGAGASAQGCLRMLISMGLPKENIMLVDRQGVIYQGRPGLEDPNKLTYAVETDCRTLADAMQGADIFLGLSGPGLVSQEMVKTMADSPMIFALANPMPEILPEEVKAVRPDALVATGRSDYPNQVNNVLCFPFIFRGALDVGATEINDEMKLACARAIAHVSKMRTSDVVQRAYANEQLEFGPDYLIPKPFDPRLSVEVSIAAAKAAMESGVATRPIADMHEYRHRLLRMVFRTGLFMRPFFNRARTSPRRIAYPDSENEVVLRAVSDILDEGLAKPVLIGNRERIHARITELNLPIELDSDVELIECAGEHHDDHISPMLREALHQLQTNQVDGVIAGADGHQGSQVHFTRDMIGLQEGVSHLGMLNLLVSRKYTLFVANTMEASPTPEQLVEATLLTVEAVRKFGFKPRVALLSYSTFGSSNSLSAQRMQETVALLDSESRDFEYDGEIQADFALLDDVRNEKFPDIRLTKRPNILIMPSRDAASISFMLSKVLSDSVGIGPVLLGLKQPVHVLTAAATVRRVVNMTALAVVEAQELACQLTGDCVEED